PGLDGPSLLERAEDEWPGIRAKFGFFTGDSLNEGARRFLEREGVLSIGKPFSADSLQGLVESIVERTKDQVIKK
ncbi:MAG: hypothetical protein AAF468_16635, partial [Pseudomonadota bacterium]